MNSIFATAMMIRSHKMLCGKSYLAKAYPLALMLEEIAEPWKFDFSMEESSFAV